MKDRFMRQRFIGGCVVSLSAVSLALFELQLWTCALGSPSCLTEDEKWDSRLVGGAFYWWTTIVQALLLFSLVLVALGSLVSLRLSKRPEQVRRCSASHDSSTLLVPALHQERACVNSSQSVSN